MKTFLAIAIVLSFFATSSVHAGKQVQGKLLAVVHCMSEMDSAVLIRLYDNLATKAEFDATKGAVVELVYDTDGKKHEAQRVFVEASSKEELQIPKQAEQESSAHFDAAIGTGEKHKLRCEILQGDLK